MSSKYTDEYLINLIKKKAIELGRTPKRREIEQVGTIKNRFGSWNKAVEKADLKILNRGNYTEEQLIEFIQDKAVELGRTPKQKDFTNLGTILRHFGTFKNAIRKSNVMVSDSQLLIKLKELKERLGKTPSVREAKANGLSPLDYCCRFKTWNNALKLAELSINHELIIIKDTDDELILKYINFCNKLNKLATTKVLNNSKEIYNKNVFENRFGSITNLKKLVINDRRLKITDKSYQEGFRKYTTEELKEILSNILEDNKGVRLTIAKLNNKLRQGRFPCIGTFYKRFRTTKINELWNIIEDK